MKSNGFGHVVWIATVIGLAACSPAASTSPSQDAIAATGALTDSPNYTDQQSVGPDSEDSQSTSDLSDEGDLVSDIGDDGPEADQASADAASQIDAPAEDKQDNVEVDATDAASADTDLVEATDKASVPLDCPSIPPMCPTWRQIWWEQPFVPGFVPFPEHPELDASAWSRLRPVQMKQVLPHTIRLWATWRNQRNIALDISKVASGFGKANPAYLSGCAMLKPSLLPTGCVILDISTTSRVVTKFQFLPKSADSWPAIQLQWPIVVGQEPPIECQGLAESPSLPVELTTTDGLNVRAYDGHANIELLLSDASADPSTIVRNGSLALQSPVEIGDATTVTQVPLDMSVCRAAVQDIAQSGCACPEEPWPPAAPTPTEDFLNVTTQSFAATITPSFLSHVEPPGWNGEGYIKKDGVSAFDGVKSTMCCSGAKCPVGAYDWECAGTGFSQFGGPAVADVYLSRTLFLFAEFTVLPYGPPGPAWLGALSSPKDFTYFQIRNGLAPRAVPARQRDGVVYGCSVYGVPSTFVANLSTTSSHVTSTFDARCCRLHVSLASANVPTKPGGPCQEIPMTVATQLKRWTPP